MTNAYSKWFWIVFAALVGLAVLFFTLLSQGILGYIPSFSELENPRSNVATEILSCDGQPLGRFYVENRSFVDYDEIAPNVVQALVATEDERFYEHAGIDVQGLFRVLFKTVVLGDRDSGGGSTITQQLAKMLFHDRASSLSERFVQKLNEWVIAVKLERAYTKQEIIAMYLNKVGFVYDAYGIESAAYTFFGCHASALRTEQGAVLVGMLKNPALYNPIRRPELVRERRNVVLGQMLRSRHISEAQCDSLKALPLDISRFKREDHKDGLAPYFREFLRLQLRAHKPERRNYAAWQEQDFLDDSAAWVSNPLYGWIDKNPKTDGEPYDIYRDGLKIYTTIDSRMQRYAEQTVKEHVGGYLQRVFLKFNKGKKYAPYSGNITEEQYQAMVGRSLRDSERWRILKHAGWDEERIRQAMQQPVEMKVFDWTAPDLERDTVMSPFDSVVYHKHFLRCGFMAMDPANGYVKAYVGGPNFRYFQYDMVGKGRRQIGSTVKPFVYGSVFDEGNATPCDLVPNSPQTFTIPADDGVGTKTWTPRNAGDSRLGQMVSLKWGLANSNNNVTAWAMKQTTPQKVAKLMNDLGIRSHIDPVVSLFLGTSDVKLMEMCEAYSAFVNHGVRSEPLIVTDIRDRYGNLITHFDKRTQEVLGEQIAYMMVNLLQAVVNQGTALRLRGPQYGLRCKMGGKTGTTQNQSDAWYMAVLPHLVCGSWVGGEDRAIHFDNMSLGQASNSALPLFGHFIEKVYADESILEVRPEDEFTAPATINFSLDCGDSKYMPPSEESIFEF